MERTGHEEIEVQRRANHWDPARAGGGGEDSRGLSQAWDQRCHVLCVEGEVWRHGAFGSQAAQGARRRECEAEEAARRGDARQHRAQGSAVKKMVTPAARREAVAHLEQGYEMSERRACSLIGADRSSVRYRHRRPDDRELREVLRGAAETHRRFGYRRLHVLLRRDGHVLNRKRTQRLYREEGLSVRRRRSRKRVIGTRAPLVTEALAEARWSVDFRS